MFGSLGVIANQNPVNIVNLLGSRGDCEDISYWTPFLGSVTISLDSANKVYGSNSIKSAATGASGGFGSVLTTRLSINTSKYYLVTGYIRNIDAVSVDLYVFNQSNASVKSRGAAYSLTAFNRYAVALQPSDLAGVTTITPYTRGVSNGIGTSTEMDGIAVYEISAADYALTEAEQLAKYPFVNS